MSGALIPKGGYYSPGLTLVDMGLIANGGGHSWTTGVTATAGGQVHALRLVACLNFIDGAEGPGSGVMLPLLTGGQLIYIFNRSPSDITVWTAENTTDVIVGSGTSEVLPAGMSRVYMSVADGWVEWLEIGGSAAGPFLPLAGGVIQPPVPLTGNSATALTITDTAAGSGVNGPATAQFGLNINHQKAGWYTTNPSSVGVGEIDGLNIYCRQGGNNSDCSGFMVNVQNTGLGFLAMCEMASSIVNPSTSAITKYINLQLGALDGPGNKAYGINVTADTGSLDTAIQVMDMAGQGSWTNAFTVGQSGVQKLSIDGAGNINSSGTIVGYQGVYGPHYLVPGNTDISVKYDTGPNGILFSLGASTMEFLASGQLLIWGTKVLGTQITGWGTPTGGVRTASFNGTSATLAQTSAALAQLILDLKTHGLLGA